MSSCRAARPTGLVDRGDRLGTGDTPINYQLKPDLVRSTLGSRRGDAIEGRDSLGPITDEVARLVGPVYRSRARATSWRRAACRP